MADRTKIIAGISCVKIRHQKQEKTREKCSALLDFNHYELNLRWERLSLLEILASLHLLPTNSREIQ